MNSEDKKISLLRILLKNLSIIASLFITTVCINAKTYVFPVEHVGNLSSAAFSFYYELTYDTSNGKLMLADKYKYQVDLDQNNVIAKIEQNPPADVKLIFPVDKIISFWKDNKRIAFVCTEIDQYTTCQNIFFIKNDEWWRYYANVKKSDLAKKDTNAYIFATSFSELSKEISSNKSVTATTVKSNRTINTANTAVNSSKFQSISPIEFFANGLGLINTTARTENDICNALKNAKIQYQIDKQGDITCQNPPFELSGKKISKFRVDFSQEKLISLKTTVFLDKSASTKAQALSYVKKIVAELSAKGYSFDDITNDIGADYARECRKGYTTYTVNLYTKYDTGKITGYELTLSKGNYKGL